MLFRVQTRAVLDVKLIVRGPGVFFATDVSSFKVTYSLNTIPEAVLTIPLGREFFTGGYSNAYALLSGAIDDRTPVFLLVTVLPADSPPDKINIANMNTYLFAGYIQNIQEVVSGENILLQVNLRHWLSDLHFSSTLSAMSHPNNPKDTIYNPLLLAGGAGGAINYTVSGLPEVFISPLAAKGDFWRNAIAPFLGFLASIDRINTDVFATPGNDTQDFIVHKALFSYGISILQLNPVTLGDYIDQVSEAMVSHLWGLLDQKASDQFFERQARLTFFGKLTELAQEFFFAIVPFPLFYRVVPFTLGLMSHWNPYPDRQVIVTNDEIIGMQVQYNTLPVPMRAVGIYTGVESFAGTALDKPEEAVMNYIGGWYIAVPDPGYGIIIILKPPPYLALPYEPSAYSVAAAGGVYAPISSMRNRKQVDKSRRQQQAILRRGRFNVLDYLAHYYYIQSKLAGRTAYLTCPFRGDICPGSTIGIALEDGEFVPHYIDSTFLYGTVMSVIYSASPEEAPTTTYVLAGLRTAREMTDINTSIPMHPLYANQFLGCPHLM